MYRKYIFIDSPANPVCGAYMSQPFLAHDHSELDDTREELTAALDDGDTERALQWLDLFWARLAIHIRAENIQLFPTLQCAAERNPEQEGENLPPRFR